MDAKSPRRSSADDWHMTDDLHVEHGKGDPFAAAIRATRMSMLISDPRKPDNPIVFVNDAFLRLTGYERHEVLGRNCRFLQGPGTDRAVIAQLREAIEDRHDVSVDVLNYKKDGTPFWNALYISPVSNIDGELQFFFASQLDVTDRKHAEQDVLREKERFERAVKERTAELEAALEAKTLLLHEVDHRVKNNLQMISSLIVMQSRTIPDASIRESLASMLARVEALSTVHRRLYQSDDVSRFDVADFIRDLIVDLVGASGRPGIKAEFDLEPMDVSADRAAPIALIVNELATNALKHGFVDRADGALSVSLKPNGGTFRIEVADDGNGMPDENTKKSFGMNLIRALSKQLGATVTWRSSNPGTVAAIDLPYETGRTDA